MKERLKIANSGVQTVKPLSQDKKASKTKVKAGKDLRCGK